MIREDEARRKWARSLVDRVGDWRTNGFNHRVQAARQREQRLFNRFGVTRAALAAMRTEKPNEYVDYDHKAMAEHEMKVAEEKEDEVRRDPAPLFAKLVETHMMTDAESRGDVGRVRDLSFNSAAFLIDSHDGL